MFLCAVLQQFWAFQVFINLQFNFSRFFICSICQTYFLYTMSQRYVGERYGTRNLLGVSSKSNIHFLQSTFSSFKYMHTISNINTSALYDLVLLSYSVVLLSRISMCLILCPLILRYRVQCALDYKTPLKNITPSFLPSPLTSLKLISCPSPSLF